MEFKDESLELRVKNHKELLKALNELYREKNEKYGNSFADTLDKYGETTILIRANDKFSRLEELIMSGNDGSDSESKLDTAIDLANYLIMYVLWKLDNEDFPQMDEAFKDAIKIIKNKLY